MRGTSESNDEHGHAFALRVARTAAQPGTVAYACSCGEFWVAEPDEDGEWTAVLELDEHRVHCRGVRVYVPGNAAAQARRRMVRLWAELAREARTEGARSHALIEAMRAMARRLPLSPSEPLTERERGYIERGRESWDESVAVVARMGGTSMQLARTLMRDGIAVYQPGKIPAVRWGTAS